MLFSYSCFNCRNKKGLLNFVSERIKLVYRINNTPYLLPTKLTAFRTSKTTIYKRHTFKLKSISISILLFYWKSFENIWSFILYLEAGETELINMCIVPFTIAEFGQKCLEAASRIKYEPLNSCITVHGIWIMKIFNVMLLNTCSHNKRRKNCEESRWRSQSALVRLLAMACLNRCQDLIRS